MCTPTSYSISLETLSIYFIIGVIIIPQSGLSCRLDVITGTAILGKVRKETTDSTNQEREEAGSEQTDMMESLTVGQQCLQIYTLPEYHQLAHIQWVDFMTIYLYLGKSTLK